MANTQQESKKTIREEQQFNEEKEGKSERDWDGESEKERQDFIWVKRFL